MVESSVPSKGKHRKLLFILLIVVFLGVIILFNYKNFVQTENPKLQSSSSQGTESLESAPDIVAYNPTGHCHLSE